jgi:cyclase
MKTNPYYQRFPDGVQIRNKEEAMLKKRIIVCLDVKENRIVKGVHFENLVDMGEPVEKAVEYARMGADEIVFLDITASLEDRKTRFSWVEKVAEQLYIPFSVGGGISSVEQARELLQTGADKISVNTAALLRPDLIKELSEAIGTQSVVVAVDVKKEHQRYMVYSHGGKKSTGIELTEWLKLCRENGAGEILLTSIDADGTRKGFDIELYRIAADIVQIPLIASGGAGTAEHFVELFTKTRAQGALAAGIFHDGTLRIPELKQTHKKHNIPVRL